MRDLGAEERGPWGCSRIQVVAHMNTAHWQVVDSNTVVGILDITKLLFDVISALEKAGSGCRRAVHVCARADGWGTVVGWCTGVQLIQISD